jgi:hypothetical protein
MALGRAPGTRGFLRERQFIRWAENLDQDGQDKQDGFINKKARGKKTPRQGG